jgi:arginine repressor
LGLRGQDLVRGLGCEIEPRGRHRVLRTPEGRAQAVAAFLEEDEQPDQTSFRFEN